jgi:pentatricopeptide repeat-containing protein PET309
MLERASTCLETGGRQILKAPKQCLRSRRMLHSTFWHHGASELPLPVWWASSPSLDRVGGEAGKRERSHNPSAHATHDGPLLDFLYPEKTLAFIRRYGSETAESRRRYMHGSAVRQYSTSQRMPWEEDDPEDLDLVNAREQMERLLSTATAVDALEKLLEMNEPDLQLLAWELYSKAISDEDTLQDQTRANLLEYLGRGDMARTASGVLALFDSLPAEFRRPSSYGACAAAHAALRRVDDAVQLLEEAAVRFHSTQFGADVVMRQCIRQNQWDLCLRVFDVFLEQTKRLDIGLEKWTYRKSREQLQVLWAHVAQLPDLAEHLQSFLDHVRQYQDVINTAATKEDKNTLTLFMTGFVPPVMDQVLQAPEPDEDFIQDFFVGLFRELRAFTIPVRDLYEYAIPAIIDTPRYRQYTRRDNLFSLLYHNYSNEYAQGTGHPPSRYLLSRLILQFGEQSSFGGVELVVKNLRAWHAEKTGGPFTPQILSYLVRFYAKHGLVDRTHEYFDEMLARFPNEVNLNLLQSLVYVYARRIDVPGAVEQFKRLNTEFGYVPDTACWNALLLAFARADDLDGALECFNNCLGAGVTPDLYTFGPMLDLCADRGDVEAFEALFSKAKALKVPVETDRRARSGYVETFLNTGDAEGAEEILKGIVQSWLNGTLRGDSLTHPWNLLLSWYGVQGDMINSRRIFRQMTKLKVPLDSWSYAALMRSLIEAKQTDAAYKILRKTMPLNNVRVYAHHYAIVISGFLNEGQYSKARKAQKAMVQRRLPQTESSRRASLLAVGVLELVNLKDDRQKNPRQRLVHVEEQLRKNLLADYGSEIAHDQPSHRRYIDSPELSNIPEGYFALVIMLYNTRGAYNICKQLFEAATRAKDENSTFQAPIALLTAIMETHLRTQEYAEVERCWELARSEANRLVKTFHQVNNSPSNTPPPTAEFESITDPSIKAQFESSRIATNRRQILFKASRTYIRSLLAQNDPKALQKAQRTVRNLLTSGFVIDNLTWNELIAGLALRGHLIDAFSACEMYLMPNFPGWAELNPVYRRRYLPGYSWMEVRHYEIKRGSLRPRYKTMVVLAAALQQVKRDEMNGLGFDPRLRQWAREVLEKIAPNIVRALETMPRTGDALQRQYLLEV